MKHLLVLASLGMAMAAVAAPDSCDDYVSRHYKKDLTPVLAKVSNVARSGDLSAYQALEVRVKNIGSETIEDNSAPGSLISRTRAIKISVLRTVKIAGRDRRLRSTFQGFMRAPLRAGEETTVTVTMPQDLLRHCQKVDIQIDSERTAGQWGCAVFGNDTRNFTVRLAPSAGSRIRFCPSDITR